MESNAHEKPGRFGNQSTDRQKTFWLTQMQELAQDIEIFEFGLKKIVAVNARKNLLISVKKFNTNTCKVKQIFMCWWSFQSKPSNFGIGSLAILSQILRPLQPFVSSNLG